VNSSEKALSCGTIISDGKFILAIRPFGRKDLPGSYDLPKGHWEEGEELPETAVRELLEETGFVVPQEWLVDLGRYEYVPLKGLHLFFCAVDALPQISTLKCTTFFDYKGKQVPEAIGYKWVPVEELNWFFHSLQPVMEKALDKFGSMEIAAERNSDLPEDEALDSARNWD
jgi:8-oxo-dGTP pyrophosphatase MutT (NUDIX family)